MNSAEMSDALCHNNVDNYNVYKKVKIWPIVLIGLTSVIVLYIELYIYTEDI